MGQVVLIVSLALAGCGRVGFDARGDGGTVDGPVDPSLIAHYSCDESGDGVADEAGRVGPALCGVGACPTRVPGIRGDACRFDGVDDMLVVPHVPALETSQGVTAAAWIRAERTTKNQALVSKPIGASYRNAYQLVTEIGGSLLICSTLEGDVDGRCDETPAGVISDGRWTHIAYTWDGTRHQAWIDGAMVLDGPVAIGFDDRPLLIGADLDTDTIVNPYQGAIDDVRVYARALTSSELAALAAP